jgi:hypothetical protein
MTTTTTSSRSQGEMPCEMAVNPPAASFIAQASA